MPGPVPFGRYVLERRLAIGGMAELMLAYVAGSNDFEKRVVIKRILPPHADDPHFIRMLADEAHVSQHLNHPNVVQVYELGEANGQAFIAMEHLTGDDLETVINQAASLNRPIDIPIACYIIAEVAEGLHHAHTATDETLTPLNIVHRDVSPANIIVTAQGTIKIVDFGIAKHDMASTQTDSGVIKGKVGYMSPEQTHGLDLDARSDVFSLGAVFYELLTLEPCFKSTSLTGTIDAIRNGERKPIGSARPGVPAPIIELLDSMLEIHVRKRCASAANVSRSLQRFLASVGVPTLQDVKTHLSALTDRTIVAAPRVHGTFANTHVPVSDAFAAPDMIMSSDILETLGADMPTVVDFELPGRREPLPVSAEPLEELDLSDGRFTYGAPPDTRIVSRMMLKVRRIGLDRALNRLSLLWAELRHRLAKQPSLIYIAAGFAALLVGLGLILTLHTSGSTKAVTTVEAIDPATLAPLASAATGRIRVDTDPEGAVVSVNGERRPGLTPLVLEDIPVGVTQKVTIVLQGFRSVSRDITLEPADGGRLYFLVNLVPEVPDTTSTKTPTGPEPPAPPPPAATPADPTASPVAAEPTPTASPPVAPQKHREPEPGLLVLDSEPPTEVRIAKRNMGKTPLKGIKLAPGTYAVQLIDVDYSKTVQVTIHAGKTTTSHVVLEKGKLLIDVRPWADVYVKNRKIGTTPLPPIELPEGDYRIRVVNPDVGVDRSLPITIQRGKTTRIVEKLQ